MICIAWGGVPPYAYTAIKAFLQSTNEEVRLVSTPPDTPRTTGADIDGHPVRWLKNDFDPITLKEAIGDIPDVLVVSGWFIDVFNRFRDEVHAHGGKVIVLSDNRLKLSWKLPLWIVYFRLRIRHRFDAFMVPGKSGRTLMRLGGVPTCRLETNQYTADPEQFYDGDLLCRRNRRIVFVGRYDHRKNICAFAAEFTRFRRRFPEWELYCYGAGPDEERLREIAMGGNGEAGIYLKAFSMPCELPGIYRSARALILPSFEDHWGVVVHEAALCGCFLMVSSQVGARHDLCTADNSFIFSPKSRSAMFKTLVKMAALTDDQWNAAQRTSLDLASKITPGRFATNLNRLIDVVREQ